MSVNAIIKDGVITNNGVSAAEQTTTTSSTTSMDDYKDQFMQLLCAQMKYQDPLEPTSNTEYISQYAQFTQVEQMQNMADAMSLSRASDMVGKTVQISETGDDGTTSVTAEGVVDYVTYSGGEAFVVIGGTSYSADDVSAVMDSTYYSDTEAANEVLSYLDKLPAVDSITLAANQPTLESMITSYNNISGDPSKYLDSSVIKKVTEYATQYAALLDAQETANTTTDTTSTTDSETTDDSTSDTDG